MLGFQSAVSIATPLNLTAVAFPPVSLTSSECQISNATYGSGIYKVRESSIDGSTSNRVGYQAFSSVSWNSAPNQYNGEQSTYNGTNRLPNSDIPGEYVILTCPQSFVLTRYTFSSAGVPGRNPRSWAIYGRLAIDGAPWVLVDERSSQDLPLVQTYDYDVPGINRVAFREYALVVKQIMQYAVAGTTGNKVAISNTRLYGTYALVENAVKVSGNIASDSIVAGFLSAGSIVSNVLTASTLQSGSGSLQFSGNLDFSKVGNIGNLRAYESIINVKGFGATGDGVTDDSAAVIAAIAYLNARGGGVLYFPRGTYNNLFSIQITIDDVWVRGDGPSLTKIIMSPSSAHVISILGYRTNVMVTDVHLVGSWSRGSLGHGIRCAGGQNIRVDNFIIEDVQSYGIGYQPSDGNTIMNMRVSNGIIRNTGADGIDFKRPYIGTGHEANLIFENLLVHDFSQLSNAEGKTGIDVRGKAHLSNITVKFLGNGDCCGIRFRPGEIQSNNGYGAHDGCLTNFHVINGGDTDVGVEVRARNVKVCNGTIRNIGTGIRINSPCACVQNVTIHDCKTGILVTDHGDYRVESGVHASINNCMIMSDTSFTASNAMPLNTGIHVRNNMVNVTGCRFIRLETGIRDEERPVVVPPGDMRAAVFFMRDDRFGMDGFYTAFGSSYNQVERQPYHGFGAYLWQSKTGSFSTSTGVYTGTANLTGTYPGEYIGLQMPQDAALIPLRYTFNADSTYNLHRLPRSWKVFAYEDLLGFGSWIEIDSRQNMPLETFNDPVITFPITLQTSKPFSRFAIVVNSTMQGSVIPTSASSCVSILNIRFIGFSADRGNQIDRNIYVANANAIDMQSNPIDISNSAINYGYYS